MSVLDTKYLKRVALYMLSVIGALGLIFYIIYHLVDGFTTDITTVTAELTTRQSIVSGDGYIFRDEKYVTASYSGTVNYIVRDGEKVSVDAPLAEVFSDSSGYSIRSELLSIEKRLSIINKSKVNSALTSPDTSSIDRQIADNYHSILSKIAEGKFSHAMRTSENLLIQMSKRQMITGEGVDLSVIETSLTSRKNSLTSQLTGRSETVTASEGGYFFIGIDGYENIFSMNELENLTVSSFYSIISKDPVETTQGNGATPIGKLLKSYKWYIALPMKKEEALDFSVGDTHTAIFSYNYDAELPVKVEKVLTEVSDDRAVVVFSCGMMPPSFNYLRAQAISVVTAEETGLRVPKTSVRMIDGVKGVYTLYGSTVVFKRINILLETDGYYIVSAEKPSDSEETADITGTDGFVAAYAPYIKLYDQIIVSGRDLKDGMVFY